MEMKHTIYKLESKEVAVKSDYARHNDIYFDDINNILVYNGEFNSLEEAIEDLKLLKEKAKVSSSQEYEYIKGTYIIVPTFQI